AKESPLHDRALSGIHERTALAAEKIGFLRQCQRAGDGSPDPLDSRQDEQARRSKILEPVADGQLDSAPRVRLCGLELSGVEGVLGEVPGRERDAAPEL